MIWYLCRKATLCLAAGLALIQGSAAAQIVPDSTRAVVVLPAERLSRQPRLVQVLKVERVLALCRPQRQLSAAETGVIVYQAGGPNWRGVLEVVPPAEQSSSGAEALAALLAKLTSTRATQNWAPLRQLSDPGSAFQLFYASAGQAVGFVQFIQDLDNIWRVGLGQGVESYDKALALLGELQAVRADAWEDQDRIRARVLFVMNDEKAVSRFQLALGFAKQLGKMATGSAVDAGTLSPEVGLVVAECLETLEIEPRGSWMETRFSFDPAPLLPQPSQ